MNLTELFNFIDGLLGDTATFQGLQFNLAHGVMIIDVVKDYEYELDGGDIELVDGFLLDFVPFDELQSPGSYFALDDEGLKEIISAYVLE